MSSSTGRKIVRVARSITDPLAQTVDVTGKFLLPGFIDAHTHFDLDVANTTTVDDFDSGSLAAIHGGTTTVIDFACPNKGETLATACSSGTRRPTGAPGATTAST